ncbi:MAG: diaminopimelate epimerase [Bacteroidales bacterium]|jgi:diaminopimelate epimerase|nr:diaminopimelate epimerase [Bacteroidales bacterium]
MKTVTFNKYQGAGNDFVIIDNRGNIINPDNSTLINRLCDRRFGIGADGLILISEIKGHDYEMKYFNADGKLGSMCGNGGRCAAHFAMKHGIAGKEQEFMAFDGLHEARVDNDTVRLQMSDIGGHKIVDNNYFIDTGSPHYVLFTDDVDNVNVYEEGKRIRWSDKFAPGGTNVNFVQLVETGLKIRTFERGVEDETLACGTGVTASAIASVLKGHFGTSPVDVRARGGNLRVEFDTGNDRIYNIWLTGPATFVFEGKIDV